MKKFISALAASVMAVSALAVMPTSAADIPEVNVLDVSTITLDASVTADDGTVIPAGATAITINISNNAGFTSSSRKIRFIHVDTIFK